ncbi:hypothetical protein PybrP1_009260 [[Pythium] brassicae (nom. inval.)]|nr:hypothetical protein PybrP1_009260 [[Pythium] brassicae (nom. inval.)]
MDLKSPASAFQGERYSLAVTPEDQRAREELLPRDDQFAAVTGPTDGLPWAQRAFMCLRPGWASYLKQFATIQEVSGAFGDIGLFLPLLTALAIGRVDGAPQIEFGPALFFAGIFTAGLSLYFNIPIPVQPMKTIAAVAIAEKYSNPEILAAGIISGAVLFVLAATNLISLVAKLVPLAIVRGIQLGVGVSVMISGFKAAYVLRLNLSPATNSSSFKAKASADVAWWGVDSVCVSVVLGALCVAFIRSRKVPIALILFVYGMAVAVYQYTDLRSTYKLPALTLGPDFAAPVVPSARNFRTGFTYLFLPQLPLTLLNSVVALEKLSADLFPKHHAPADVRRICFSLAGGNLLFAWFGMLPVCHGAGGLASQHAFGARSSLAMVFLGTFKVFFALLFGSSCVTLLQTGVFPQSVLGVLLVFSGLTLAAVGLKIDTSNARDTLLLLLTAGGALGINTGAGFLIGFGTYLLLLLLERLGLQQE